ncbi:MAG TPA: PGPGW domain-containing protein [Solirubrobacteraceae bacterium]|nr:PGPGW domain-containing protein [Solirubrobacteraceae bacterium]
MTEAPREQSRWADRLAERRERYKERGRLYRIAFVSAGVAVTLVGLAMLVLPGPALVVIPIGLAMLAMEFAWAEAMLEKALMQAEKAQASAKEATPRQKALTALACVLLAIAAVAAVLTWDIPILPDK